MKEMGTVVGVVLLMILITEFLRPFQRFYHENPMLVIIGVLVIIALAYLITNYRKAITKRKSK
jgi:hypothetical protein